MNAKYVDFVGLDKELNGLSDDTIISWNKRITEHGFVLYLGKMFGDEGKGYGITDCVKEIVKVYIRRRYIAILKKSMS